jgi:prepilin-type N-terminal cleavage/methylation domain-containing protein
MAMAAARLHRAFTLTELLVVMGIVTVLLAILLPTISRAREASRVVVCMSKLREIGSAWQIWGQKQPADYHHRLPDIYGWTDAVMTVDKSGRILYCPSGEQTEPSPQTFSGAAVTQSKNYGGNGHPFPVWTPDPSVDTSANSYVCTITYHNIKPGQAILTFNRISGNSWKCVATKIDAGGNWGGPPINMVWGSDSWMNITQGQVMNHTGAGSGSTYGYNIQMSNLRRIKPGRILAIPPPPPMTSRRHSCSADTTGAGSRPPTSLIRRP